MRSPLPSSPATRIGLSVAAATGLYGISFGALAVAAGLDTWQAMALSTLMFTGGSQFAYIGVLAGGGAGPSAFAAATLLGTRNAVYALQLNSLLRPNWLQRPIAAHLTIDESTAVAVGQFDPAEQRRGFWVTGIGVWVLWSAFTLLGALAGSAIGDPKTFGLDGAAVAAFMALLWPRLKAREPIALAVAAAAATLIAVPVLPPGLPILVAAVVAVAWALLGPADPKRRGLEPGAGPRR